MMTIEFRTIKQRGAADVGLQASEATKRAAAIESSAGCQTECGTSKVERRRRVASVPSIPQA